MTRAGGACVSLIPRRKLWGSGISLLALQQIQMGGEFGFRWVCCWGWRRVESGFGGLFVYLEGVSSPFIPVTRTTKWQAQPTIKTDPKNLRFGEDAHSGRGDTVLEAMSFSSGVAMAPHSERIWMNPAKSI